MIVFSHGFGVDKNSRGLFSNIVAIFGKENCVQFDYNDIDSDNNTITVTPLNKQAEKLREMLASIDEPINLICHSQGCLVAALAMPVGLQSILFLAPASTTTSSELKKRFNKHLKFDKKLTSHFVQRTDGTKTIINQEYWDSLDAVGDVDTKYVELASKTFLTVITAGEDDLVDTRFDALENKAEIFTMPGADHNFTGSSREKLLDIFRQLKNQRLD